VSAPAATVLIRTKDEAASIGRLLEIVASQTIADRLETIVVDSGSSDDTVAIARAAGATVIEIPASEFTYGRALNIGTAAAHAEIVIALSAHAFPRDGTWAERLLAKLDRPRVACACGAPYGPNGTPLSGELEQDLEIARLDPRLGYSNSAGAYRTELWRRRPFREDMPFTEDKEWAQHWLEQGWTVMLDPALEVDHDHSHDPLRVTFRRSRLEWIGLGMYLDVPPYPLRALLREWWTETDGHENHLRARLSPWRAMRLLGRWAAMRG
jgi:rhamnosyltransferase